MKIGSSNVRASASSALAGRGAASWLVVCTLSFVALIAPALGQEDEPVPPEQRAELPPPPPTRVFHDVGSDFWHLFTSLDNGLIGAGGGALALAVSADDRELTRRLQDDAALRAASKPGGVIGNGIFQFGIGTAFYVWAAPETITMSGASVGTCYADRSWARPSPRRSSPR